MRNDILKILDSYPASAIKKLPLAKGELYLIGEREQTISALTALMCYREVKAFIIGMGAGYFKRFPSVSKAMILHRLQSDYTEPMILQAIEQVKKEMK